MKSCYKCLISKPISDFYKDRAQKSGISKMCKLCDKLKAKSYYLRNRNNVLLRVNDYWKTPEGKEVARLKSHRMIEKYPEKYKTRLLTRHYIKTGKITKKPCEICGESKVEVHHKDYSDAINVNWYCSYHHRVIEGRVVRSLTQSTP